MRISLLLSKALFKEAYNNQIWIVTFKIKMNINVDCLNGGILMGDWSACDKTWFRAWSNVYSTSLNSGKLFFNIEKASWTETIFCVLFKFKNTIQKWFSILYYPYYFRLYIVCAKQKKGCAKKHNLSKTNKRTLFILN